MSTSAYSNQLKMDMPPPSLPPFLLKAIPKDHAQKRRASRAANVCVDNADDATVKRVKHKIEAECLKAKQRARDMSATPQQIADYQNDIEYMHKIEAECLKAKQKAREMSATHKQIAHYQNEIEYMHEIEAREIADYQNDIEYMHEIEAREMYATHKQIADYQNDIEYIHMCQGIDIDNP